MNASNIAKSYTVETRATNGLKMHRTLLSSASIRPQRKASVTWLAWSMKTDYLRLKSSIALRLSISMHLVLRRRTSSERRTRCC